MGQGFSVNRLYRVGPVDYLALPEGEERKQKYQFERYTTSERVDALNDINAETPTLDDAALLAEVQQIFPAEVVETMPRAEGERRWGERLVRQRAAIAAAAQSYLHPWPDALPGLGPRAINGFDHCADCGAGTWAGYGGRALCLRCAKKRVGDR
jgi:hypothetical protein